MDENRFFVDDPLRVYLAELKNIPPLGPEEERDCVQRIRARDKRTEDAAKRLLEGNLQLVVAIAERYPHEQAFILDLIQAGNSGLLAGVNTICDSSEDNFPIHATPFVERAMAKAVAAQRVKSNRG